MAPQPTNILVIKLCCLGDIIFLTPAMRTLRRTFPDARMTMLVTSWVKDLVQCIPFVDDTIVFDAPYHSLVGKIRDIGALIHQLRRRSFDFVFVGHRNKAFGLMALLTGAKSRVGFGKTPFLTNSVPFDATIHEVDRYLKILEALGMNADGRETEIHAHPKDVPVVENLLRMAGLDGDGRLIGIFPGGGTNPGTSMKIKRWYPEQYISFIERLLKVFDCRVALLGSQSDAELNETIRAGVHSSESLANLAGQTSLREFVALASRLSLFVGGDSGPLHIAAAAGTPTVSIFGPSDPRLVAPRGKAHRYVWNQVSCAPCYTPFTVLDRSRFRGSEFICWTRTHACLKDLQVEAVFNAVTEVLALSPQKEASEVRRGAKT